MSLQRTRWVPSHHALLAAVTDSHQACLLVRMIERHNCCCACTQASQREQSIRIQSSGGLSEEDIQNMVRDAESYAEKDKERKAAVEAKNEAETAIYSAEKSLADYKDKVVSSTWKHCQCWASETSMECVGD